MASDDALMKLFYEENHGCCSALLELSRALPWHSHLVFLSTRSCASAELDHAAYKDMLGQTDSGLPSSLLIPWVLLPPARLYT